MGHELLPSVFACPGNEADYSKEAWYRDALRDGINGQALLAIAERIQKERQAAFLRLPPGITFEAEHMGVGVVHDEKGRRYSGECPLSCGNLRDFSIPEDGQGVWQAVRESVAIAKGDLMFCLGGAFSICLNLMGVKEMSKAMRKDPEGLDRVLSVINAWLLSQCRYAIEKGAKLLYYSDATALPDLYGQTHYGRFAAEPSCRLIRDLLPELSHSLLYICGRTADGLYRTGRIKIENLPENNVKTIAGMTDIERARFYKSSVERRLIALADDPQERLVGMGCLSQDGMENSGFYRLWLLG